MTKFKKKSSPIVILGGIILIVLFLGKTNFIGSFLTTCENYEPTSVLEYSTAVSELGGTTVPSSSISFVLDENTTVTLQEYVTNSVLGNLHIIDCVALPCNTVLLSYQASKNGTYLSVSTKNVMLADGTFYWCNQNNNILLSAVNQDTFTNYWNQFEVCTTIEVVEERQENATVEEDEPKSSYSGTSSSTSTSFTPVEDQVESGGISTIKVLLILSLVLFTYYWFFEKGPEKGIFKKK